MCKGCGNSNLRDIAVCPELNYNNTIFGEEACIEIKRYEVIMEQFQRRQIDIYEEKLAAERVYEMYLEGRILFPRTPVTIKLRKIKKVSDMLEELLMGLPFPAVYVSELQDGRLLILDTSDRVRCLFDFFEGKLSSGYMELYPELEGYDIRKLEEEHPRITSLLYQCPLKLQIIDYLTPKYLHMQVGNHVEKWNFSREQGVRNALYGGKQAACFLERLARRLQKVCFFSRSSLNRQYAILRIIMYRLIVRKEFSKQHASGMGLQMLLDQTFQALEKGSIEWLGRLSEDILGATDVILRWNGQARDSGAEKDVDTYDLLKDRGKEQQIRFLGYVYNVVWLCNESRYPAVQGLMGIVQEQSILERIQDDVVNDCNITKHWEMICMQWMR